jgi:sigma-B regulation protein RsbU (phosphoserine phosphatase)
MAVRLIQARYVGGDYYDFFDYGDGRIGIVIADASGKGLPSALIMTGLQGRVHILAEHLYGVSKLVTLLNDSTVKHSPAERYATLFFAVLNISNGELVYCNAGLNPPMIARHDGSVEGLSGGGGVVGLFVGMKYEEYRTHLDPGDSLLLCSDGITDCMNAEGEDFGEDRLAAVLRKYRDLPARAIIEALFSALNEWDQGAEFADDVTAVVVRRQGPAHQ